MPHVEGVLDHHCGAGVLGVYREVCKDFGCCCHCIWRNNLGACCQHVTNGSFESGVAFSDPFITLNATDSTSITGWTVSAGSIDYIGSYWQPADGSRSLDMNGLSTGAISSAG